MFRRHFEILEENVTLPNLGREFFTGDVARELARSPGTSFSVTRSDSSVGPSRRLRANAILLHLYPCRLS
jgi:hypothetical protein